MKFNIIQNRKDGFTLVELAIVITIIGILIGGVLKGQQLIEQAKLAATISQVNSYRTAVSIFKTTYNGLPGDLQDPDSRIVGCSGCAASSGTQGNNAVGNNEVHRTQGAVGEEPYMFWLHMVKADMISGVSDAAMNGAPAEIGVTHPASKMGGGWVAVSGSGGGCGSSSYRIWASGCNPYGLNLVAFNVIGPYPITMYNNDNTDMFSPMQAAQIDRKMDDGKSRTGDVVAAGGGSDCNGGGPNNDTYNESATERKRCNLAYQIMTP